MVVRRAKLPAEESRNSKITDWWREAKVGEAERRHRGDVERGAWSLGLVGSVWCKSCELVPNGAEMDPRVFDGG